MRAATLVLLMILASEAGADRSGRSFRPSGSGRPEGTSPTSGPQRPGAASKAVPYTKTMVLAEQSIDLPRAAELRAVVSAQCGECAWDTEGREAVTLTTLGGRRVLTAPAAGPRRQRRLRRHAWQRGRRTPHDPPRHRSCDDGLPAQAGRRRDRATRGHAALSGCARASGPGARAVRLRASGHGRALHRCAGVHVVRTRADGTRRALPLFRDLHERGWRHADRSPDGDLGPHDRHRVHLQHRSGPCGRDRRRGLSGAGARGARVPGQTGGAPSAVVGGDEQQHGARRRGRRRPLRAGAASRGSGQTSPARR